MGGGKARLPEKGRRGMKDEIQKGKERRRRPSKRRREIKGQKDG